MCRRNNSIISPFVHAMFIIVIILGMSGALALAISRTAFNAKNESGQAGPLPTFPLRAPDKIRSWNKPTDGLTYKVLEVAVVGGTCYIAEVQGPKGETHIMTDWDTDKFPVGTFVRATYDTESKTWKLTAIPQAEVSRDVRDHTQAHESDIRVPVTDLMNSPSLSLNPSSSQLSDGVGIAFPNSKPIQIMRADFMPGLTYQVMGYEYYSGERFPVIQEPNGTMFLMARHELHLAPHTFFKAVLKQRNWEFVPLDSKTVSRDPRDYDNFYFSWP